MNKGIKVLFVLTMSLSLFACGKKDKNATTTKKTNSKVETTKSHLTRANIREFETITYGTYPQTEEKDSAIISNLSSLAGTLPTNDDDALWTKFDNYFCETVYENIVHDPEYGDYSTYYAINGYMWYIDLDINSDGTYDYRGIYFSEPRAANYFGYDYGRSNQGDNGYSKNTAYWFKYEPIEWIILDNKDGKKLVMSKLSIDSFGYNSTMEAYYNRSSNYNHNGGTGYSSNYELSELRRWTNNDFYSLAFTLAEQEKIKTTLIDNSKESFFGNPGALYCENTNDKIFYLSLKEASIYFDSEEERQTKGTDYAKASGVLVDQDGNASWMLRSPRNTYFYYHYCIYPRGFGYTIECFSVEVGIRPVMWIDAN